MEPKITKVDFEEWRDQIGRLRMEVWSKTGTVDPTAFPTDLLLDDDDAQAHHWTVTVGGRLVASAKLAIVQDASELARFSEFACYNVGKWKPIGYLGRLVVLPENRGAGIAKSLDQERLRLADQMECHAVVALPATTNRISALEILGFESLGQACADAPGFQDLRCFAMVRLAPAAAGGST